MDTNAEYYRYVNEFKVSTVRSIFGEPESCITKIECVTTGTDSRVDSLDHHGNIIAKASFSIVKNQHMGEYFSWLDLLDVTWESARYMELFKDNETLTQEVTKKFERLGLDPTDLDSFFTIDRLEMIPKYRGLGITEGIIEEALDMFSARIPWIALVPFPMQFAREQSGETDPSWQQRLSLNLLPQVKDVAVTKLEDYAVRNGFTKVEGNIFVKPNDYL